TVAGPVASRRQGVWYARGGRLTRQDEKTLRRSSAEAGIAESRESSAGWPPRLSGWSFRRIAGRHGYRGPIMLRSMQIGSRLPGHRWGGLSPPVTFQGLSPQPRRRGQRRKAMDVERPPARGANVRVYERWLRGVGAVIERTSH